MFVGSHSSCGATDTGTRWCSSGERGSGCRAVQSTSPPQNQQRARCARQLVISILRRRRYLPRLRSDCRSATPGPPRRPPLGITLDRPLNRPQRAPEPGGDVAVTHPERQQLRHPLIALPLLLRPEPAPRLGFPLRDQPLRSLRVHPLNHEPATTVAAHRPGGSHGAARGAPCRPAPPPARAARPSATCRSSRRSAGRSGPGLVACGPGSRRRHPCADYRRHAVDTSVCARSVRVCKSGLLVALPLEALAASTLGIGPLGAFGGRNCASSHPVGHAHALCRCRVHDQPALFVGEADLNRGAASLASVEGRSAESGHD